MNYTVIRSKRKTISLEVRKNLQILVRAPHRMSNREIASFVANHEAWLKRALEETARRSEFDRVLDDPQNEIKLRQAAKEDLPKRTADWANRMGVIPTGVKITGAKTRFGSCSAKNVICYSWRLMAYPEEAIDYVVVHELAHILQKNHSPRFYAVVEKYLPDWKRRRELLKIK